MICGTFNMANIPDGQQDAINNGFSTNVPPPTTVTKSQAPDGTWTVTAVWPPCPAETTTTHSGDAAAPAVAPAAPAAAPAVPAAAPGGAPAAPAPPAAAIKPIQLNDVEYDPYVGGGHIADWITNACTAS